MLATVGMSEPAASTLIRASTTSGSNLLPFSVVRISRAFSVPAWLPVGAVVAHGVVDVGHGDDPGLAHDLLRPHVCSVPAACTGCPSENVEEGLGCHDVAVGDPLPGRNHMA